MLLTFVQDKSGVGFRVTCCCPLSYTKLHVFSPNVRGDCLGLHLWEIRRLDGIVCQALTMGIACSWKRRQNKCSPASSPLPFSHSLLTSPLSPPYTPHLTVRTEWQGSYLQARGRCSWETAHPAIPILDSRLPDRENTFLFLAPSTVSSSHGLRSHGLLGLWDSWDNKRLVFQCRKSWEDRDKRCDDKVSSPGLCIFRKSLNIGGKFEKLCDFHW